MNIVWLSNAPWCGSGYGEQTALFVPRLNALGHDVSIAANHGLQSTSMQWKGITVFSASLGFGNPSISTFAKHRKAEWVIALYDSWVMRPDEWADDLKMAIWAPVDHWPIPPEVLAVLRHPKVRPIAMSKNGLEWMQRFELDPLYVPHGVDTSIFRPLPELRAGARGALSIPDDAFIVGMVAANKGHPAFPRKGFPQAIDAFARFAKRHEDAYLYLYTESQPKDGGIDLVTLSRAVGCPEDRVGFPPEHAWHLAITDNRFLASLYQAFDVLLNPSMGEGFGVPILEAQACGVPVIASDHSAMTELVKDTGWLVQGDRWWDAMQASFAIVPSIASIEEALEAAYEDRGNAERRTAAVEFAQAYDADKITQEHWVPALEALGRPREIGPLNGKVSRQVRRAEERKRAKVA